MNQFALKKIAEVIGSDLTAKHCVAAYSTEWLSWNAGSYSYAKAGCAKAHQQLAARIKDSSNNGRLYFAGEACEGPESGWGGSFSAAYLTGIRAGNEVARDHNSEPVAALDLKPTSLFAQI